MPRRKKSWLHRKLKLSQHKHSGKRIAVHHTSFGLLLLAVLFSGVILGYATNASAQTTKSLDGSVSISGYVPRTNQNTTIIRPASTGAPELKVGLSFDVLWIIFIILFSAISTFWLGERYEWEKLHYLWTTQKHSSFFNSYK